MGMKRGVSLYSYQQSQFFRRMNLKDMLREVATNLGGATGIEIISEANIPDYPMPPESFFYEWNNEMARWGLEAVTMDTYLDTLQFRDHVMTHAEAAEHIKYDLRLAKRMGFRNMRLVHNIPFEAIALALPLAEELDVRITNEIHPPASIRPKLGLMDGWGTRAMEDVAFAQRMNTKHYGLQPDFGIFQNRASRVQTLYILRERMSPEKAEAVYDELMQVRDEQGQEALVEHLRRNYADVCDNVPFAVEQIAPEGSAKVEDLYTIAPYIYCVHGKFYQMTEVPGKPGQYTEESIQYEAGIQVLKGIGYDGYIDSEYEGQRSRQDLGDAALGNEVEEVRRHHEMLRRLIGE